jgi:hypothetical protein
MSSSSSKDTYEKEKKNLTYAEAKARSSGKESAYPKKEAKKEGAEVKSDIPTRAD